ncbi:MAG: hypothetical protein ABIA11_04040 [Patescibacteria group bacterium]|nr:hypothetical protein [Patescibacteria group bacterium]
MFKKRKVFLVITFVLIMMDVVGFLLPGIVDTVRGMGWDVNRFWFRTVWGIPLIMVAFCVIAWFKETDWFFLILNGIFPFYWAIVLFIEPGATEWMVMDAFRWLVVGFLSIYIWADDFK